MSPMMKKKNLFFSKMSIAEEQNDFPLHFAWNMLLDRHGYPVKSANVDIIPKQF